MWCWRWQSQWGAPQHYLRLHFPWLSCAFECRVTFELSLEDLVQRPIDMRRLVVEGCQVLGVWNSSSPALCWGTFESQFTFQSSLWEQALSETCMKSHPGLVSSLFQSFQSCFSWDLTGFSGRSFFLTVPAFVAAWAFSDFSEWELFSSCGKKASHCSGFSYCRSWALVCKGSVLKTHRLSCLQACGIFPNQGSNPYPLYQQADS